MVPPVADKIWKDLLGSVSACFVFPANLLRGASKLAMFGRKRRPTNPHSHAAALTVYHMLGLLCGMLLAQGLLLWPRRYLC